MRTPTRVACTLVESSPDSKSLQRAELELLLSIPQEMLKPACAPSPASTLALSLPPWTKLREMKITAFAALFSSADCFSDQSPAPASTPRSDLSVHSPPSPAQEWRVWAPIQLSLVTGLSPNTESAPTCEHGAPRWVLGRGGARVESEELGFMPWGLSVSLENQAGALEILDSCRRQHLGWERQIITSQNLRKLMSSHLADARLASTAFLPLCTAP